MNVSFRGGFMVLVACSLLGGVGCGEGLEPDMQQSGVAQEDSESLKTMKHALVHGDIVSIRAVHSLKCLDVEGVSPHNGARIQQWDCSEGLNQRFRAISQPDGSFKFAAIHSDRCLDVVGASTSTGVILQQWDCWGGDNQRFWVNWGVGGYRLRAKHSDKYVDVSGSSLDNGASVYQWDYVKAPNQEFYLEHW